MKWWISIILCVRCIGSEVPFGAHATLRASANGKPSPSYVWYKDGIEVGREANLQIASATLNDAGDYVCRASNGIGPGAVSTPIKVVVAQAPIITGAFPNVTILKQATHTLSVTAYGPALSYKWLKGGRIIPGQTLPTLTINKAKPPDAGTYECVVENQWGRVSATAKVTVK
jgi:hypothetical protein